MLVIAVIINDISGIEKIVACQLRPVIVFHSGKGLTGLLVKGGKRDSLLANLRKTQAV